MKIRIAIAALALSAAGLVGIVTQEGYTDTAVIPVPGDVPTIGFGTTDGVKMGDKITPPVALARALQDVQKFEGALKRCVNVPLHQYEYDAYVDFAYNIGAANFCGSRMVELLNKEEYADACAQFDRWTYFRKKDCKIRSNKCYGLVTRRSTERAMCEGALQ